VQQHQSLHHISAYAIYETVTMQQYYTILQIYITTEKHKFLRSQTQLLMLASAHYVC